jgi:hypothetical protein
MARTPLLLPFVMTLLLSASAVACAEPSGVPTTSPLERNATPGRSSAPADARPSVAASATSSATEPPPADDVHAVMADAIAADRPTLRFDLHPDRLDGSWILDGNADDGFGPGRLYVVVSPRRGDLTAHPCGDPDFRQGGPCIEEQLPDGDRLVLRDRVTRGGVTTVLAVLIHPDRSGITAEASNMAIDFPLGPLPPGGPEPPVVTRPAPVYSVSELGVLLLALDGRLGEVGAPAS